MKVDPCVEIELDNSILMAMLNKLAPFIPQGTSSKELYRFIQLAFNLVNEPTLRTDKPGFAVWECEPRFLELLPTVLAGELSFCALNDILYLDGQEMGGRIKIVADGVVVERNKRNLSTSQRRIYS
jgi:hypothetical protein